MDRPKTIDQETRNEMIRRLVETAHPEEILLFGAAQRGGWDQTSDLDLRAIMPDGMHRRRTAQAIDANVKGIGLAKDIVVATASDVRNYGDNPS